MADIDEFAQTRGADDLFDDEIIPVSAEEQQAQTEAVTSKPEPEPMPARVASPSKETSSVENQPSPRGDTALRGRGGERGRGRGRGRGKGGRGGLQDSIFADPKRAESSRSKSKGRPKAPEPEGGQETETAVPETPQDGPKEQPGPEEEDKAEVLIANGAEPQRVPAVRGDRSATGGVRKPKLTEEELSKRIAAAKENAAKKAAAHARAEADQASFLEREQIAAKKRRQEVANRRVMDNEREQNRQRKLNAQTGREWDSEKREEDYKVRGGGSQFRRGMHGGVSGYARRDFHDGRSGEAASDHGSPSRGRGRGRGGRGSRSRGPRGERASSRDLSETTDAKTTQPSVHDEANFPSLPAAKKPESSPAAAPVTTAAPPTMEKLESTMSPVSGTWADQVEE